MSELFMAPSSFLNEKQLTELKKQFILIESDFNLSQFLKKNKKNKQKFYNDFSFYQNNLDLSQLEIQDLIEKNLLKVISDLEGRMTLTFKALIMLKYEILNPDSKLNDLINDFNKEFFENVIGKSVQSLEPYEKAIIITLLGLGAFSNNYALKVDDKNKEHFKKAVDRSVNFLKGLGSDFDKKEKLDEIWSKNVVGEGPVLGLMRRTNNLPIRTENIYSKTGGHHLDILRGENIDENKLSYLLNRLFDIRKLDFAERKKLIETIDEIQKFEFKLFKNSAPYDTLSIRKKIKRMIEKPT